MMTHSKIQRRSALLAALLVASIPHLPGRFVPAGVLQSVPEIGYAATALALVGLCSLVSGSRVTTAVTITFAISFAFLSWQTGIAGVQERPSTSLPVVKVSTWNTRYWDQGKDDDTFARQLVSLGSDVGLLQEYVHWDSQGRRLVPISSDLGGHPCCAHRNVWQQGELVTTSRYPGTIEPTRSPYILAVVMDIGGREILVVNVHVPVHLDVTRKPWTLAFWRFVADRSSAREAVFSELAELLEQDRAIVVGGDFNATTMMPEMRTVLGSLDWKPSTILAGTYPAHDVLPTLWRIDHLLTRNIRVGSCEVVPIVDGVSDHHPIRCAFGDATS